VFVISTCREVGANILSVHERRTGNK